MKVVINIKHGGFGLSREAALRYLELAGKKVWIEEDTRFGRGTLFETYWLVPPEERVRDCEDKWHSMSISERQAYNKAYGEQTFSPRDIPRNDDLLIRLVEEMGQEAGGRFASLKIVEIPDGVDWQIEEYDGAEWVAEKHRTWS